MVSGCWSGRTPDGEPRESFVSRMTGGLIGSKPAPEPSREFAIYHFIGAPMVAVGLVIVFTSGARTALGWAMAGAGVGMSGVAILLRQIDRAVGILMILLAIGGAVFGLGYLINVYLIKKRGPAPVEK